MLILHPNYSPFYVHHYTLYITILFIYSMLIIPHPLLREIGGVEVAQLIISSPLIPRGWWCGDWPKAGEACFGPISTPPTSRSAEGAEACECRKEQVRDDSYIMARP